MCFPCICNLRFSGTFTEYWHFNQEPQWFIYVGISKMPQTLVAICRNIGICDVFRTSLSGKIYLGYVLLVFKNLDAKYQGIETSRDPRGRISLLETGLAMSLRWNSSRATWTLWYAVGGWHLAFYWNPRVVMIPTLSLWQPPVSPDTSKLVSWQLWGFSVRDVTDFGFNRSNMFKLSAFTPISPSV